MQEVKILRLSTGEDVIAKVGENDQGVSLKNPFVIIPQQRGPGQPLQLMMSLYNAFGKKDTVTITKEKIVFELCNAARPSNFPERDQSLSNAS